LPQVLGDGTGIVDATAREHTSLRNEKRKGSGLKISLKKNTSARSAWEGGGQREEDPRTGYLRGHGGEKLQRVKYCNWYYPPPIRRRGKKESRSVNNQSGYWEGVLSGSLDAKARRRGGWSDKRLSQGGKNKKKENRASRSCWYYI